MSLVINHQTSLLPHPPAISQSEQLRARVDVRPGRPRSDTSILGQALTAHDHVAQRAWAGTPVTSLIITTIISSEFGMIEISVKN